MKIYKKKGWEKPEISNLRIKDFTLSGKAKSDTENAIADKRPSS